MEGTTTSRHESFRSGRSTSWSVKKISSSGPKIKSSVKCNQKTAGFSFLFLSLSHSFSHRKKNSKLVITKNIFIFQFPGCKLACPNNSLTVDHCSKEKAFMHQKKYWRYNKPAKHWPTSSYIEKFRPRKSSNVVQRLFNNCLANKNLSHSLNLSCWN